MESEMRFKVIQELSPDLRVRALEVQKNNLSDVQTQEILRSFADTDYCFAAQQIAWDWGMLDLVRDLMKAEVAPPLPLDRYHRAAALGDEEARKNAFEEAVNELEYLDIDYETYHEFCQRDQAAELCEQEYEITQDESLLNRAIGNWEYVGRCDKAAALSERLGDYEGAAEFYEDDGQLEKAVQMWERAEQWARAAYIHLKISILNDPAISVKNFDRALDLLWEHVDPDRAIGLAAQKGDVEYLARAFKWAEIASAEGRYLSRKHQPDRLKKRIINNLVEEGRTKIAGEFAEKVGDLNLACEFFAEAGKYGRAGDAALRNEDPKRARNLFIEGMSQSVDSKNYSRAARLARKAGLDEEASRCGVIAEVLGQGK